MQKTLKLLLLLESNREVAEKLINNETWLPLFLLYLFNYLHRSDLTPRASHFYFYIIIILK
jgi:hypothetical protein